MAVPESLENPEKCIELNDIAVFNTYQAALDQGVRRLIFSSSSAVYGEIDTPHHEDLCPRPSTPYALHKLLGEHYGLFFQEYRGLESVYLRYFNVYGPVNCRIRLIPGSSPCFWTICGRVGRVLFFDDGCQTRDFVYVEDVVRANLNAASAPGLSGQCLNIGGGRATSIVKLYQLLAELAGRPDLEPQFAPARPGDIRHSFGPVDKAARLMDFRAEVSLAEGLARTWSWFVSGWADLP